MREVYFENTQSSILPEWGPVTVCELPEYFIADPVTSVLLSRNQTIEPEEASGSFHDSVSSLRIV